MQERNLTIDYARFLAIVFVVLGHLIQYNDIDFDKNYIFKLIYSFHMPLFILISGFVSFNSLFHKSLKIDIQNKIVHLLVPFFLWGIFLYIIEEKSNYLNLILFPDSAYWFLWVLFWIYLISKITIFVYIYNKFYALVFLSILYVAPSTYFSMGLIKYLSIYFIFGLLAYKYQNRIYKLLKYMDKSLIIFFVTVLFLFLAYYYDRGSTIYYSYINLNSIYIKALIYGYKLFLAGLGIILTLKISEKIANLFSFNNFILTIGQKYTLVIYVTHYYFLQMYAFDSFYISILANSTIIILFITICYFLLQYKCNRICQVFFGILSVRKNNDNN